MAAKTPAPVPPAVATARTRIFRIAIGFGDNLLLSSRCISSTHEAHSSYRVMSGVSAISQAASTAAALAAQLTKGDVRAIHPEWIRHTLRQQVQFVEGTSGHPPGAERKTHNPRGIT